MAVYILKRVGLALITLWILSMIVFWVGQQLPGDPGRTILGNLATPAGVAALDHKLGVDRPIVTQYKDWVTNLAHGDMGTSYSYQAPIRPFITTALVNSLKLALVAFFMCVPLAIASGVIAALKSGQWVDRSISVFGLSLLGLPEFVSGVFLIMIFGIWLNVLPVGATPPAGAGPVHPGVPPDTAGDRDRMRAVRLHHADGPGRDDRGAQLRLHPHGRAQRPADQDGRAGGTCFETRFCPRSPWSRPRSDT